MNPNTPPTAAPRLNPELGEGEEPGGDGLPDVRSSELSRPRILRMKGNITSGLP